MIGALAFVACVVVWYAVLWFANPDRHKWWPDHHRHDYRFVGYGGAGWSLYRCPCGAEEIDA